MKMETLSPSSITARIVDAVTSGTVACMEGAAQLSIGQTILRFIDRFLWIVEKSAQWSLPCPEETAAEENGKSFGKVTLVRPLPWIFFLPSLMLLRILRVSFNVGAFVVGYPRLEPSEIVKYVQKSRRRLRAIKTNGMKSMRQRKDSGRLKDREMNLSSDAKWRSIQLIRSIRLTLSSLSCLDASKLSPSPPPVQIKMSSNHESTPTPEEKSTTESASSPMYVEAKRKYSEVSSNDSANSSEDSEEETIQAKIERIAAQSKSEDENDDDFDPADLMNSSNELSSVSTSDESGVSASELQDIQDEANMLLHRACAGVTEVIKEEAEPRKRGDGDDERTGRKTKFENPNAASECHAEDAQEFHSPCKFGEEGDTAFYSPISSKSSSPERTAAGPQEQGQKMWLEQQGDGARTKEAHRNGELSPEAKAQISVAAPTKTTNGHGEEKSATRTNAHPAKATKSHYKGRRTANASRKKK